jgi:septal ring factor EnvC (AmiA/AmiB activator)
MSFFRISKQSFLILAFLLSALLVHAQKSTQKQLEEKKADIKKELKEINALLFTNKQNKAAVFSDVENLSYKIERKQELIKLTNQQINLLNQEIEDNSKSIEKLETLLIKAANNSLETQNLKIIFILKWIKDWLKLISIVFI